MPRWFFLFLEFVILCFFAAGSGVVKHDIFGYSFDLFNLNIILTVVRFKYVTVEWELCMLLLLEDGGCVIHELCLMRCMWPSGVVSERVFAFIYSLSIVFAQIFAIFHLFITLFSFTESWTVSNSFLPYFGIISKLFGITAGLVRLCTLNSKKWLI